MFRDECLSDQSLPPHFEAAIGAVKVVAPGAVDVEGLLVDFSPVEDLVLSDVLFVNGAVTSIGTETAFELKLPNNVSTLANDLPPRCS